MRSTTSVLTSLVVFCALLVLAGCGGNSSSTHAVVTVTIDQASPVSVTVNGTRLFTATVTGASDTSVTWSVQEGASGGAITGSGGLYTAPATVGTFHVIATSVADTGKSATVTVNVVASSTNTAPTASFTVTPSSGTTSTSFAVDASGSTDAQDATSALQVRWDWNNDGTFDTAYSATKTANHTFAVAGSYTIKLEVKDTGGLLGTTTHAVTVTNPSVNTAPTASFTVSPGSGTTSTSFAVDASGSTDAQDATSALQVRWDWENDGTFDTAYSTTKTANHTFAAAGSYTIKLEVKDTGALLGTTTHAVTVTNPTSATFTLTLDGTLDTSSGSTKASSFTSAALLNTSGSSVATAVVASSTATFDLTGLSAGTYFVRVNNLADDLVPVRIDSTSTSGTAFVGTRLRDVVIGTKASPTYRTKTFSLGQSSTAVAKYSNGTAATPTRYAYATEFLKTNPQNIEIRVLGTGALLTSQTDGGEHSFATWMLGTTNHGTRTSGCGCHGSKTNHPASYSSISVGSGWCFRCHYGQSGPASGMVDPAQ